MLVQAMLVQGLFWCKQPIPLPRTNQIPLILVEYALPSDIFGPSPLIGTYLRIQILRTVLGADLVPGSKRRMPVCDRP